MPLVELGKSKQSSAKSQNNLVPVGSGDKPKQSSRTSLNAGQAMANLAIAGPMVGTAANMSGSSPRQTALSQADSAPLAGQIAGSVFGKGGEIAGATGGETIRQIARAALKEDDFKGDQIVKTAATTAAMMGVIKGAEKTIFSRQYAASKLNQLGSELGKMKEFMSKAGEADNLLHTNVDDILNPIKEGFEKIAIKRGGGVGELRGVINKLEQVKASGRDLTPNEMIQLEDFLGNISKFNQQGIGGISLQPKVVNKTANELAKNARSLVSKKVEEVAERAGLPRFSKLSRQISEIKQAFPGSELRKPGLTGIARQLAYSGAAGTLAGIDSSDPSQGAKAALLTFLVTSPQAVNTAYKSLKAAGVAGSEAARRISYNQPTQE